MEIMNVLFSTRYGSHLYGTSVEGVSDLDYKYIVLPSLQDLILGKVPKNKVKKTNKIENTKNSAEDVDEEFIPLHVFAKDVLEGQTYALELVWAVEYDNAKQTICHPKFLEFCRELRSKYMTKNMGPMVGYAMNQANLYSAKGERLNAATAAFAALYSIHTERFGVPHASHYDPANLKLISIWPDVVKLFEPLAEQYPKYIQITGYAINPQGDMRPCIKVLEKILPSSASLLTNLNTIQATIDKYGARAKAAQEDEVDWKATAHALRIIYEGISLLSGKGLSFPMDKKYVDYFLDIKAGRLDHKLVMEEISTKMDELKFIQLHSSLPEKTFELETDMMYNWLYPWLLKFYNDFEGLKIIPISNLKENICKSET
jgi:hypothetical protein